MAFQLMKKIAFVTTGHISEDNRIYHKFAKTLANNGYLVNIISTIDNIKSLYNNIQINSTDCNNLDFATKMYFLNTEIDKYNPDIVICCEPFPVYALSKYCKTNNKVLIYDITEWYPYPEMLVLYQQPIKSLMFIKYFIFNLYCIYLSDRIIYGEKLKSYFYNFFFFMKKSVTIHYYSNSKNNENILQNNPFTVTTTGHLTTDRGINNILGVLINTDSILTKQVIFNILGVDILPENFRSLKLNNIKINVKPFAKYDIYKEELQNSDLLIDLRNKIPFYNYSEPIKIFDFISVGKPFIFSNLFSLKWIKKDIKSYSHIINPINYKHIADIIKIYSENKNIYDKDTKGIQTLFRSKYNWDKEAKLLLKYISEL